MFQQTAILPQHDIIGCFRRQSTCNTKSLKNSTSQQINHSVHQLGLAFLCTPKYTDRIKRRSFLTHSIFMPSFHVLTLYKPQQLTPLRLKPRCNVKKVRYPVYEPLCATNCPPIFRTYLIFQLKPIVLFKPLWPGAPEPAV